MGHTTALRLLVALAILLSLFTWAFQTTPEPIKAQIAPTTPFLYGLDAVINPANLPQLGAYTQTYMVSSYDRTGENNDAGNYLYQAADDRFIIFDQIGSGIVYRIWMTGSPLSKSGRILFYFDNETTPRVDLSLDEFFSGKVAPFLYPVVGNNLVSSGGYFSYIPMPYAKRLKIATTAKPQYYHISYQKLAGTQNFASYTGNENYTRLYAMFSNIGEDPKPPRPNRYSLSGSSVLSPGKTIELGGIIKGPAVISAIRLKFILNETSELLSRTTIKGYWDGRDVAQVDAPLDYFFGSGFGERDVRGLMAGISRQNHEYYNYYPMPFRVDALLTLTNTSPRVVGTVEWEVVIDRDFDGTLVNENTGYFNALIRRELEPREKKDHTVLFTRGRGKYVGSVMNFYSINSSTESDERIFIDGSQTPHLHGTGYEDYFNAAYGFNRGAFSQALHGAGDVIGVSPPYKFINIGGYRFHMGDAISFNNSFKLSVEHGFIGRNTYVQHEEFRSLAFWYSFSDQNALEETDKIDIGIPDSEKEHNYSVRNLQSSQRLKASYEGEDDYKIYEESGNYLLGGSEFTININPNNNGVVLRRRFDYNDLNQQANIFVDGQLVGRWFSAGQNQSKRWRDEDFPIPANFTKGKSTVRVRVEVVVEPAPWSEFHYTVFSLNPRFGFIPQAPQPTPMPTVTPTPVPVQPTATATPLPPRPTATPVPVTPPPTVPPSPPNPSAFLDVWARTDEPVAKGLVTRSWTWGALTNGFSTLQEDYDGNKRLVQYHDKARMEFNTVNGIPFVTNGLLVKEMVAGRLQIGDNAYLNRAPAQIPVVGDPTNNEAPPTYASFLPVSTIDGDNRSTRRIGEVVTATLTRNGTTSTGIPAIVRNVYYDDTLGHNIPDVFWNFMNGRGLILAGNSYRSDVVFDWVFALGYPISEAYWTRAVVGGVEKDVLVQAFERRILSYTPTNPPGFQVEMGNVGRHYYSWRYS
jgi:hypothetical protein